MVKSSPSTAGVIAFGDALLVLSLNIKRPTVLFATG
jgi:hypothetical protein